MIGNSDSSFGIPILSEDTAFVLNNLVYNLELTKDAIKMLQV